jgi:Tol biopolymer transport system component
MYGMNLKRIFALSVVLAMLLQGADWRVIGNAGTLASLPDQSCKAPQFSPDGKNVAFSGNHYQGIYIVSATGGAITEISRDNAAGWRYAWSPDSRKIAARVSEPGTNVKALAVYDIHNREKQTLDIRRSRLADFPLWLNSENLLLPLKSGSQLLSLSSGASTEKPVAWFDEAEIFWRNSSGEVWTYTFPDKIKIISLTLAPDGQKVAAVQKNGQLSILKRDKMPISLGEGYAPAWSPESDAIVFMRTEDDGHDYTSGDLYIAELSGKVQPLLITPDTIEIYPHWSPDGSSIVFENYSDATIELINIERRR